MFGRKGNRKINATIEADLAVTLISYPVIQTKWQLIKTSTDENIDWPKALGENYFLKDLIVNSHKYHFTMSE